MRPRRLFRFPFFSRRQVDRDIDDELSFHLEMRVAELERSGLTPDEAKREARRRFGDLDYTRRYCRGQSLKRERRIWRAELLFDLGRDVRYALRHLRRSPAYSGVAVTVLALGIGASVAVFSVLHGVLLSPLAFSQSNRLVRIWDTGHRFDGRVVNVNPLNFLDWQADARSFEDLGGYFSDDITVRRGEEGQLVYAAFATPGLFPVLRLSPLVGRTFTAEEDQDDPAAVVVLGYGYWQSEMGGDPGIVGTSLVVEGVPHEIVGVLGPEARLPVERRNERPGIWLPSGIGPDNGRGGHWLRAVGRLAPGTEIEGAQEEMSAIARSLEQAFPRSNTGVGVRLEPLRESIVSDARDVLLLLAAAVGLLLLLACGNVSNMALARGVGRRGEIGVRAALGASRGRILRQFLAESLCLAAAGGAIGILVAALAIEALKSFGGGAGPGIPRLEEVGLDLGVTGFAIAVSVLCALGVGLVPGLFGAGRSPRAAIVGGGTRGSGSSRGVQRAEGSLAVFQIALATVLITAAGLLFHSLLRLRAVDPGYDLQSIVAVRVIFPEERYGGDGEKRTAFLNELLERARSLPGVVEAGASDSPPLQREQRSRSSFRAEDRPEPPPDQLPSAWEQYATPGYLSAAGIPLLAGRSLEARDDAEAVPVIVVNDVLARSMWPDGSAIGKRVQFNGSREVVGVVGSIRRTGPDAEPEPELTIPYAQWPYAEAMFVMLRTTLEPDAAVAQFRSLLRDLDPGVPIGMATTMERLLSESLITPRFRLALIGSFAVVALVLAAAGVYAVLSYVVNRRRREFGLRLAVGADPGDLIKLVMRRGLGLAALGVALGLAGSLLATRGLRAFLFGVGPADPLTYGSVGVLFMLVAALACWIPALRATRTDPVLSLRLE